MFTANRKRLAGRAARHDIQLSVANRELAPIHDFGFHGYLRMSRGPTQ
jgi:hypothetical protein